MTAAPASPDSLLADLTDTRLTFEAVAERHSLTVDQLALWLASTSAAEYLEPRARGISIRVRLTAAKQLPCAVEALSDHLRDFLHNKPPRATPAQVAATHAAESPAVHTTHPPTPTPTPTPTPQPSANPELLLRERDSIRRTAAVLLRLANYSLSTAPPRPRAAHDRFISHTRHDLAPRAGHTNPPTHDITPPAPHAIAAAEPAQPQAGSPSPMLTPALSMPTPRAPFSAHAHTASTSPAPPAFSAPDADPLTRLLANNIPRAAPASLIARSGLTRAPCPPDS